MDNQSSVWFIVLGSMLALVTSLIVEIYKNWMKTKNNEKDFKITLKLELKSILETINRLIETYGQKQYFAFVVLSELLTKTQRLDKIRDKVIYVKNDVKKEEILSLFNSINLYYSDIYSLESMAFSPAQVPPTSTPVVPPVVPPAATNWNDEMYKSQRQILAFRGTDLERSVQDTINFLER